LQGAFGTRHTSEFRSQVTTQPINGFINSMNNPHSTSPPQSSFESHHDDERAHNDESSSSAINDADDSGSSVVGAIFNFTNCIVGAGAIGLGGAIAQSGGLVSVLCIILFAILTKRSLDLVICLSLETQTESYEDLGQLALGQTGKLVITVSKFLYSFGCLIAYVVVIKDNMGPALSNLLQGACQHHDDDADHANELLGESFFDTPVSTVCQVLRNRILTTWVVCIAVVLPLCLLRDMRPLASLSAVSIASILAIVGIILYLYADNPHNEIRQNDNTDIYDMWLQVRPGFIECLGTFVFTFVSQHTVHLAFQSLKPSLKTSSRAWKRVSSWSVGISAVFSLLIGLGVYVSFGQKSKSDIFEIYPQIPLIDVAKLLLSVTMVLTFPLPFFTCRELLILNLFPSSPTSLNDNVSGTTAEASDLEQPLLAPNHSRNNDHEEESTSTMELLSSNVSAALNWVLLPEDLKQLKWPFHVAMTIKLWLVSVGLAIAAPSLGDVLDLVGCATGTIIAFIVPSCLSFKLRGYSLEAALLLLVGGVVGIVGTYFSLLQIVQDLGLV